MKRRPEFLQPFFVDDYELYGLTYSDALAKIKSLTRAHRPTYTEFSALQTSSTTTSQRTKHQARQSCGWQSQGCFKFLGLFSRYAKQETVAPLYRAHGV